MRDYLLKGVLACVCLALVAISSTAQKGRGGGGSGGGTTCAVVATPVLSTTTASPGTNVGVFSRVGNCSSGKKRFTITVSAMSSCGEETVIASQIISFDGGQYKLISTSYGVAPDTCLGTTEISVRAYSGETMLSSASAMLELQ